MELVQDTIHAKKKRLLKTACIKASLQRSPFPSKKTKRIYFFGKMIAKVTRAWHNNVTGQRNKLLSRSKPVGVVFVHVWLMAYTKL